MWLKDKAFEIIIGVIAAVVIAVGMIVMFVSLDTDTEIVSIENGQWTRKVASSNGFGYCLDDLATELGLEATCSTKSDDACYYVRQHGAS